MRWLFVVPIVLIGFVLVRPSPSYSLAPEEPQRKAFGMAERVPWTTSKVVGSPEPPSPYRIERVYPNLTFTEPLELIAVPGKKQWVVAEQKGKIFLFDADPKKASKQLLLDVGHTVYGIALHPKFAENGYLFVTHIPKDGESPTGSHLSRFTVKDNKADPKSAKLIFTWPTGGHNGGCIRFGPDGFLYLVTGDGSGIADELKTGQNVGDVLAAMLRIDVNTEGEGYAIPKDNPFVGVKDARPELWAYGLRQAWKFSFDTANGDLWAGEVGQDLWEMVLKIEKGGNYGWSVSEGLHPFRPERPKGPSPILKPIVEHNHSDFRSITGGYIYHGKRLPALDGAYIYGDYDTGRIWMLKYDAKAQRVTANSELTDTTLRIVAWGQDIDGEVVALDYIDGGIYQLATAPPPDVNAPKFPRKLSETGLFASTKDHKPAPGLIPYEVNSELWSDGAFKERFIAIPGNGKIEYETMTYPQPAPGSVPGWRFPNGTVFVKTFALDMKEGDRLSRRRLETRLFVVERVGGSESVGDQVWNGYTYIWNDEQTDAELADAKGVDREYVIESGNAKRSQKWHYPSRAECNSCHTVTAKYALGVNTAQLNRDHDYDGTVANQLATFEHIGIFDRKLPDKLPKLVDYRDEKAPLDARARAYLHANCSHCHRKWGGGNAEFQLLSTLKLEETGTLDVKPGQGAFDLKDPRLLVPGQPERSMIYHRMTRLGLGRMPHIASNVVDESAVKLIRDWIAGMK